MAAKRTFLILFGAQGSGKGTQAQFLRERLRIPQVATGDLFRMHLGQQTELGKLAKSYMDRGELVPDDVTVAMVRDRLSQTDAAKGAILDGFPRNLAQAEALDAMLAEWKCTVSAAIYIMLERDALMKRLTGRRTCKQCQAVYHIEFSPAKVEGVCDKCGGPVVQRGDDADEAAVARRLELYFEQTTPVIDYYRGKKVLAQVDGNQSIKAVQESIQSLTPKPAPKKPAAKKAAGKKPVKKAPAKKVLKKTKPVAQAVKKAAAKKAARK